MPPLKHLRLALCAKLLPAALCAFLLAQAPRAQAGNLITNGSFSNTGTITSSYAVGTDGGLPGWTVTTSGNKILDCLVYQGATTNVCGTTAFGGGQTFWAFPGFSPDGGNYLAVDADSTYASPISQTISGLTVGQTYYLSFYQAGTEQKQGTSYTAATTQKWQVTFAGTSGTQTFTSAQMSTTDKTLPPGNYYAPWQYQATTFTATDATMTLTFLAQGTPTGQPPFALLDGVSMLATPEPATYALVGLALIALPLATRMRKARPMKS